MGGWVVATNFCVSSRQGFKLWGLPPFANPCRSLPDPCLSFTIYNVYKHIRYTVAGVFSRCLQTSDSDCCLDPVVYTRTNVGMRNWIRSKAPGVRDSAGCPKKIVVGLHCSIRVKGANPKSVKALLFQYFFLLFSVWLRQQWNVYFSKCMYQLQMYAQRLELEPKQLSVVIMY